VPNRYVSQIRRRRLEKLSGSSNSKSPEQTQGATENSSPSTTSVVSEKAEPTPKPKININKAQTTSTAPAANPFNKLSASILNGADAPTVRTTPAEGELKRQRAKSDGQTSPRPNPPKKQASAPVHESIEAYENRTLGSIFRITLDPNQTVDSSNHKLIYLPSLHQELKDEKVPIMLTKERLDSAILEAASAIPHTKGALDYLIPCWKRVMRALKGLRGYANAKDAILKEAKRLCMSNCVFAMEMPEFFGSVIVRTVERCR
jgi:ubiquitin conjugation factor E4 B